MCVGRPVCCARGKAKAGGGDLRGPRLLQVAPAMTTYRLGADEAAEKGKASPLVIVLFAAALLFGVLPSAPPMSIVNTFAGVPLQGPLIAVWFLFALFTGKQRGAGIAVAFALGGLGLVSAVMSDYPFTMRTWLGSLLVPLLVFAGLQFVTQKEVRAARTATRAVLFAAAAYQVIYFVQTAGAGILSPSFVIGHHTDTSFWEVVGGRVLGNPNNASVVFCAAFAWGAGEWAQRSSRMIIHWPLMLVSALAIWTTGSRGATLTAALSLLFVLGLRFRSRMRPFLLIVLVAGLLLGINAWLSALDPTGGGSAASSLRSRGEARLAAIPIVATHPWGTGPGSTADAMKAALSQIFRDDGNGATSHDLFLNWGVSVGWLGLLLLLVALWIAARRALATGGFLALMPLMGFLMSGEAAGIDLINSTNPAWSMVLWAILGLTTREAFRSDMRILRLQRPASPLDAPHRSTAGRTPGRLPQTRS